MLCPGSPAHVPWFVVAVVVDAIKGELRMLAITSRRSKADIGEELRKIAQPLRADFDSATAVTLKEAA